MQYIIIGVMAAVMVFCAILAAKYSKEQKETQQYLVLRLIQLIFKQ